MLGCTIGGPNPPIEAEGIYDCLQMRGFSQPFYIFNNVKHVSVRGTRALGNARGDTRDCFFALVEQQGGNDPVGNALRRADLVEFVDNRLYGRGEN